MAGATTGDHIEDVLGMVDSGNGWRQRGVCFMDCVFRSAQ